MISTNSLRSSSLSPHSFRFLYCTYYSTLFPEYGFWAHSRLLLTSCSLYSDVGADCSIYCNPFISIPSYTISVWPFSTSTLYNYIVSIKSPSLPFVPPNKYLYPVIPVPFYVGHHTRLFSLWISPLDLLSSLLSFFIGSCVCYLHSLVLLTHFLILSHPYPHTYHTVVCCICFPAPIPPIMISLVPPILCVQIRRPHEQTTTHRYGPEMGLSLPHCAWRSGSRKRSRHFGDD